MIPIDDQPLVLHIRYEWQSWISTNFRKSIGIHRFEYHFPVEKLAISVSRHSDLVMG